MDVHRGDAILRCCYRRYCGGGVVWLLVPTVGHNHRSSSPQLCALVRPILMRQLGIGTAVGVVVDDGCALRHLPPSPAAVVE